MLCFLILGLIYSACRWHPKARKKFRRNRLIVRTSYAGLALGGIIGTIVDVWVGNMWFSTIMAPLVGPLAVFIVGVGEAQR